MPYIKLFVVGCVAVFSLVFFFSQGNLSKGGDYLDFLKVASSVEEVSVGNCVPESIGNQYFRINKPDGFCSCIMEGKKKQGDIIAGGSTLDEYEKICVEIFYKDASLMECSKINAMLAEHNKKGRVECECFSMVVQSVVTNLLNVEEIYMGESEVVPNSKSPKEEQFDIDYIVVPDPWVHKCIRSDK